MGHLSAVLRHQQRYDKSEDAGSCRAKPGLEEAWHLPVAPGRAIPCGINAVPAGVGVAGGPDPGAFYP